MSAAMGVSRQLPWMSTAVGVNRQLPWMSTAVGVNRRLLVDFVGYHQPWMPCAP